MKDLDAAKSRLADRFPASARTSLVLAMLHDTLDAAAAAVPVSGWSVVTPDSRVARFVHDLGGHVIPEPPLAGSVDDRLNTALASADRHVRGTNGVVDVIALQADLPALRTDELEEAFTESDPQGRSVVVDHTGTGTAALIVRGTADPLGPQFGEDSARRHIESGAAPLTGNWPGLRLDVDTAVDVRAAVELGVGPHTGRLLGELGWL
ncbi:2-phospho-L-lactate guanylyltransferase [Rhodococcoides trifolii]|uniref:2-phospho-L-lactate guanylyltransferase n=1 Tax=Rhodococcoides trifolii TaxID=908250 RepID=A0A917D1G6_9NOCA|nr:2-phospho-L-lactate guanylyltransferase [Rhodococcus trifolii]